MADVKISRTTTDALEAKTAQRDQAKRATFEMLVKKPRLEREVPVKMVGDDGETFEAMMLFRAIGARDYDRLLTRHPPTTEQRAEGTSYNINTFGPALISMVCIEPEMSPEQATEIWNSSDWGRGEVMSLFSAAVELCNKGLDIPFTATG
jgi:hypothetical protein